jgi:hypothetical protein
MTSPAEMALCQALEERAGRCDVVTTGDLGPCIEDHACFRPLLRPSSVDMLYECLGSRDCQVPFDMCVMEAGADYNVLNQYSQDCWNRANVCQATNLYVWCSRESRWVLFRSAVVDSLTACFSEACADVEDCLVEALNAVAGPGCFGRLTQ